MQKHPPKNVEAATARRDADLHATLQKVVSSKHPYVNNTLKRIAKAAVERLTKLEPTTK